MIRDLSWGKMAYAVSVDDVVNSISGEDARKLASFAASSLGS